MKEEKFLKVSEIKPNPWNYNEMDEGTFAHLRFSEKVFGNLAPILVWQKGKEKIIVDGEHRWKAAVADKEVQIKSFVLTSEDLLEFYDKIIQIGNEEPEYAHFKNLAQITDKELQAEFIARSLTSLMNKIRGETNPLKYGRYLNELIDMMAPTGEGQDIVSEILNAPDHEILAYTSISDAPMDEDGEDDESEDRIVTGTGGEKPKARNEEDETDTDKAVRQASGSGGVVLYQIAFKGVYQKMVDHVMGLAGVDKSSAMLDLVVAWMAYNQPDLLDDYKDTIQRIIDREKTYYVHKYMTDQGKDVKTPEDEKDEDFAEFDEDGVEEGEGEEMGVEEDSGEEDEN